MTPDVARTILRAFQIIRDSVSESELARIVASGNLDELIARAFSDAVLDPAFMPVRDRIRKSTADNVKYFTRDLPKAGKIDGVLAVSFDVLSPKVIDAIRSLEAPVLSTLKSDVREVVRAYAENGLRDGASPRTVAKGIRSVIGLGPAQEQQVRNFRDALLGRNGRSFADYTLRDKRFDRTLAKTVGAGEDIRWLDPNKLRTVNDATDRGVYDKLVKNFSENGWQGRPVLVMTDGDRGYQAWTGSHRILAAQEAGIKVPAVVWNPTERELRQVKESAWFDARTRAPIDEEAMLEDLRNMEGINPEVVKLYAAEEDIARRITGQVTAYPNAPSLTPSQIEKMVTTYRNKRIAQNAETTARTSMLQSMKSGQRLAWQDAIDKKIVDGSRLFKRWSGVMDERERPEHVAMQGQTVPFDAAFSNGESVPGESTFNCRCLAVVFQRRAA